VSTYHRDPITDPEELRRRFNAKQNGQHEHAEGRDSDRPSARAVVRCMTDVEPRSIEALWPGYIVAHKFNLIAGYGGVGKGQIMANLIARASRGDPMPGEVSGTVARTLILAAEDDAHEDIRPRLDANHANLENVLILDGVDLGDGDVRWVDVQQHIALVRDAVIEYGVDLVYLDPLASYMPGVRRQNGGEVRDALGHLQRLINETGVTVIGALHLGKEALNRRGAMKVLDSVEYVNTSRNVLGVNDLPDEHQPEDVLGNPDLGRRKVIAVLKSNSMIPGPPLMWSRARDAEVHWHGVAPVSFDDSFASAPPETMREGARDWLHDFLNGGMQPQAAVEREGKAAGFSLRTLNRVKAELGAKSIKDSAGPWYWQLPPRETTPADASAGGQP
jgi:hypothetical protein